METARLWFRAGLRLLLAPLLPIFLFPGAGDNPAFPPPVPAPLRFALAPLPFLDVKLQSRHVGLHHKPLVQVHLDLPADPES